MKRVLLVTGGSRSGKSRYAMETALEYEKRVFIATAPVCDEEMRRRIEAHQAERANRFTTIEAPTDLAAAFDARPPDTDVILLDCLTVWTANLMHLHGTDAGSYTEVEEFFSLLDDPPVDVILVTNEVGYGVVPENAMARRFRDIAGSINQRAAAKADKVVLVVCGIPMVIKDKNPIPRS